MKIEDVPAEIRKILGSTSRERINTAITSAYKNSVGKPEVELSSDVLEASEALRKFMFERVYLTKFARGEEEKAERMISALYEYFVSHKEQLPPTYVGLIEKYAVEQVVCDYISSMTDRYAVYVFNKIFVPRGWTFIDELN